VTRVGLLLNLEFRSDPSCYMRCGCFGQLTERLGFPEKRVSLAGTFEISPSTLITAVIGKVDFQVTGNATYRALSFPSRCQFYRCTLETQKCCVLPVGPLYPRPYGQARPVQP